MKEESKTNYMKTWNMAQIKESKEKSQSELKVLHLELMLVTLACVGISFVA